MSITPSEGNLSTFGAMSNDPYSGKSPMDLAYEAEKDLNSGEAKRGHGVSDSSKSLILPFNGSMSSLLLNCTFNQ